MIRAKEDVLNPIREAVALHRLTEAEAFFLETLIGQIERGYLPSPGIHDLASRLYARVEALPNTSFADANSEHAVRR